jgi:tetratricopeptide (TPR) repeat protein
LTLARRLGLSLVAPSRGHVFWAFALLLVVPGTTVARAASGPTSEAWATVHGFHEDLTRIDRTRDLLEGEVARTPTLEALLLLAWAHFAWADHRATTTDAKLAGYARGRDVARRAIEVAPQSPDAHLWYAANLGRWAVTKGKLRAAFLVSTLKEEIRTVLALDPNHVAGLSLAGSIFLETPRLLGGDVARAEGYLRKALTLDPRFTRARVELARCLIERERFDEAREELRRVIDEPRPRYLADWVVEHRPAARQLLEEIRAR